MWTPAHLGLALLGMVACGCTTGPRDQHGTAVLQSREEREAIRRAEPELFADISQILYRHDPIGINFETNTDEYDAEAGSIIARRNECTSEVATLHVVHEEFTQWFGAETAGVRGRYAAAATELWHRLRRDEQ